MIKTNFVWRVIGVLSVITMLALIQSSVLWLCWNTVMPGLFPNVPFLSWWQAVLVFVGFRSCFGNITSITRIIKKP